MVDSYLCRRIETLLLLLLILLFILSLS